MHPAEDRHQIFAPKYLKMQLRRQYPKALPEKNFSLTNSCGLGAWASGFSKLEELAPLCGSRRKKKRTRWWGREDGRKILRRLHLGSREANTTLSNEDVYLIKSGATGGGNLCAA